MRALIIDDDIRLAIQRLCKYADEHRLNKQEMQRRVANPGISPIGDDPHFKLVVPMNYTCIYTIEEHPMGWSRHLSVSVNAPKEKTPSPEACAMLMVEFGFSHDFARMIMTHGQRAAIIGKTAVWLENAGERTAVNFVEALS